MHLQANIISLEQRRRKQLLNLMFIYKDRHNDVRRIHERNTRAANVYSFVRERYNNVKYKNSPYYKGSLIWDTLPNDVKRSSSIAEFRKALSRIYVRYDPLLV